MPVFLLQLRKIFFILLAIVLPMMTMYAGECPKTWIAFRGSTPTLDGVIGHDEYADADSISGFKNWFSDTHTPSQDVLDFSGHFYRSCSGNCRLSHFHYCDS